MNQYIKADFMRIRHKKTHLLSILFLAVILPVVSSYIMIHFVNLTGKESLMLIGSLSSILLGVSIFSAVFADDFRSKTMQVAIGRGLSRGQVILAKEMELLVLTLVYTTLFVVMIAVTSGLCGSPVPMETNLAGFFAGNVLSCMGFYNLAMIPVFLTQKSNIGEIVYLLLSGGFVCSILTSLLSLGSLPKFLASVPQALFSNCVNNFTQGLESGHILFQPLAGCLIWILAGLALTQLVFRKKELEF